MKVNRLIKYNYLKLLRLKGTPQSLALGTAIGVFIGLTPTIPFHTVLILAATLLTRSSSLAGLATSWLVCNPLTYIPIYYAAIRIGSKVTPYELNWEMIHGLLQNVAGHHHGVLHVLRHLANMSFESLAILIIGGSLFALPFAILTYYYSLRLFCRIQKKKATRRHARVATPFGGLHEIPKN